MFRRNRNELTSKHYQVYACLFYFDGYRPRVRSLTQKLTLNLRDINIIIDTNDRLEDAGSSLFYKSNIKLDITTNIKNCDKADKSYFLNMLKSKLSLDTFKLITNRLMETDNVRVEYRIEALLLIDNEQKKLYLTTEVTQTVEEHDDLLEKFLESIYATFDKYLEKNLHPVRNTRKFLIARAPSYFSNANSHWIKMMDTFALNVKGYFQDDARQAKEFLNKFKRICSTQDSEEKQQQLAQFKSTMPVALQEIYETLLMAVIRTVEEKTMEFMTHYGEKKLNRLLAASSETLPSRRRSNF